jgi:hypothetical protein
MACKPRPRGYQRSLASTRLPLVKGVEVRDTFFISNSSALLGYDSGEVDDLLRRVAAELDAGRSARPLIENARFQTWARRPYDIDAVDWVLDQILRCSDRSELAGLSADPWRDLAVAQYTLSGISGRTQPPKQLRKYFAEECRNAWRNFRQQPGTYLRWEQVNRLRGHIGEFELRTADQQTIASMFRYARIFNVVGRSFTVNGPEIPARSTADSWAPGIAELAARSWRDNTGHYAAKTMKNSEQRDKARGVREFVDETGTPILYTTGASFWHRAHARVTFPDQQSLRFLVRGTMLRNAIMTAVDQAGNKVARYRITRRYWSSSAMADAEVAVHPDRKLTDELILAIAISSPWLETYFHRQ